MNLINLHNIQAELLHTPQKAQLVAVTKYSNLAETNEAIKNGVNKIAENRVENMLLKFPDLLPVEKHFIGVIQTKKIKLIVQMFDVIESVANIEHLQKINAIAQQENKKIKVFIQINISHESQKSGFLPNNLWEIIQIKDSLNYVIIAGIMGIAQNTTNYNLIRAQFHLAKNIFDDLKLQITSLQDLSLGMSNDYKIALNEGATLVRIGSIIFKE